jgi:Haem-binding domain
VRRPSIRHLIVAGLCVAGVGLLADPGRSRRVNERIDPALALGPTVPDAVMQTVRRACFDCHSDETRWPWYASLPPASWLITHDVVAARRQINFSRWQEYDPYDRADMLDKVCDLTSKGRMPVWAYRWLHRDARLRDAEVLALCAWADREARRLVQGGP